MHLFVASILLLEKLSDVKTSYALFEIEMSLRSEIQILYEIREFELLKFFIELIYGTEFSETNVREK